MVLATEGITRVHGATDAGGRNVGDGERVLSVVAGGALALAGVRRCDLAGVGLALVGAALVRRGATGHSAIYRQLGLSSADGRSVPRRARGEVVSRAATVDARRAIKVERAITIRRAPAELYALWRDFEQLPRFMRHIVDVRNADRRHSHWVARLDGGKTVEWDAEIVNDLPGELIAWKTVGDPDVAHAGSVHFRPAPADRGTIVRIVLDYEPPARGMIERIAHVFGHAPDQMVAEELRRFKRLAETGEIISTEGQTSGR